MITIENFYKQIKNLANHELHVGITAQSNRQNRADIFRYLITDFGQTEIGEGERDPLFKETNDNEEENIKFLNNIIIQKAQQNNFTYISILNTLGAKILHDVKESIETKGHGTWRPNTPNTIAFKQSNLNPIIRSHANDIYISEGHLLNSLIYETN